MVKIPITKTLFGAEELRAVQLPLESGWVVQGPQVLDFEEKFSSFTSAPHAIATSSCTTALHIAVTALGLRPGDEVIVPAFTWISTANVVEYQGAKPVFCDIELDTFNLDWRKIEALVTPKTVGVLPVHLFGLCAEMAPILEIAQKHGLWVVEDAACGFGARYDGRHAGTFGAAGCFSFHPRKSITTGEGGMITTASDELDELARCLRDHGASRSDLERHESTASFSLAEYEHLGFNYRMTDLQGALGSVQMDRAEWILEQRRACAKRYDEMLEGLTWLTPPSAPERCTHAYQAYVCLYRPEDPEPENAERLHRQRDEVMARMELAGVATRPGTHAAALARYYRERYEIAPEDFPNAYLADRLSLALPLYPQMDEGDQGLVVDELRRAGSS